MHFGGIHLLVFHAGCGAGDVRAIVVGRGLCDDRIVPSLELSGSGACRLDFATCTSPCPRAPGGLLELVWRLAEGL